MDSFSKNLAKTGIDVPESCLDCADFRDLFKRAEDYSTTPAAVALTALRLCSGESSDEPALCAEEEPEYWQTAMPKCEVGRLKQTEDAIRNMVKLGGISRQAAERYFSSE